MIEVFISIFLILCILFLFIIDFLLVIFTLIFALLSMINAVEDDLKSAIYYILGAIGSLITAVILSNIIYKILEYLKEI